MKFNQIVWPVFRIGERAPITENGRVFYTTTKFEKETHNVIHSIKFVDDKNIELKTLAGRRLVMLDKEVPLYPLRRAIFFLGDLIKTARSTTWFIDSTGKVFQYTKSSIKTLIFREISNIIPIDTGGALIEVKGIPARFKCLYMPEPLERYAGLIQLDSHSFILYGVYTELHQDTKRKV